MSAEAAGAGWDDASRFHRWRRYRKICQAVALVGLAAQLLLVAGWPPVMAVAIARVVAAVVAVAGASVLVGSWRMQRKHDSGLCAVCAGEFPLDAAATAERRLLALRVYHFFADHWRRDCVVLVVWVVAAVAMWWIFRGSGWADVQITGSSACFVILTVVMFWSTNAHAQLEPWCPFCGDDGDDDDDVEPVVPDPVAPGRQK